jgi:hypothetical protein
MNLFQNQAGAQQQGFLPTLNYLGNVPTGSAPVSPGFTMSNPGGPAKPDFSTLGMLMMQNAAKKGGGFCGPSAGAAADTAGGAASGAAGPISAAALSPV